MNRLVLVLLVAGCSHARESDWVGHAQMASQRTDEALARNDVDGAREALRRFVESPIPSGVAQDDRRVVLQDAYFRLAELELIAGRAPAANDWAERGLALGRARDLFSANLLVVRGRAMEAQGQDRRAADDYHEALVINDELLSKVMP